MAMTSSCLALSSNTTLSVVPGSSASNFALAMIVIFPIYSLVCAGAFLYYRESSVLLRKRSFRAVLLTIFAGFSVLGFSSVFDVVGADRFPCLLLLFLLHIGAIPFATIPQILKIVHYSNCISVLHVGHDIYAKEKSQRLTPTSSSRKSMWAAESNPFNIEGHASKETFLAYLAIFLRKNSNPTIEDRVNKLKFMKSRAYIYMWIFFAFLPGLVTCAVRIATDKRLQQNCTGCFATSEDIASLLFMTIFGLLVGTFTVRRRSLKRDSLLLLSEFRQVFFLSVPTMVALILFLVDPGATMLYGQFNWLTLCLVHVYVAIFIMTIRIILHRPRLNNVSLEDAYVEVNSDRILKEEFRKFLDRELSSEVYWFMDAVDDFVSEEENNGAMFAEAEKIFVTYIKAGSPHEVNLSHEVRETVTKTILERHGVTRDVFHAAYEEVFTSLVKDGFARFLKKMDKENKRKLVTVQQ